MHTVQYDVAVLVQLVVGQFDFVKRDRLLSQPGGSLGRRVRVNVNARRHRWIGLAGHRPGAAVEGISIALIVHRRKV